MDIRIRRIFGPFARVVALLLERMKITIRVPLALSVLTTLIGTFSFYLLYADPWSADLSLVVTILMFSSGIVDEITRQLADLKQKKLSELERVVLGLDRYTDMPIVLAALYFLRTIDFEMGFLNFGLTVEDHLLIGALFFGGVYLAGFTARKRTNTPGLETRAERTFYLTAFMITGYTHDAFPLYLLIGISSLGILLYLASFYSALKGNTKEGHLGYELWKATRPIKHLLVGILDLTKNIIALFYSIATGLLRREEQAEAEEEPQEKQDYVSPQGHNFTALITDGGSSQPIVNATIALKNKETGKVLRSKTNQTGKSNFSGIDEGEYAITVDAEGYKVEEFERFLSMDSGEVFVLSRQSTDLSVVITDADTRLPVGGSLVKLKFEGKEFRSKTDNLGVAYFKDLKLGIYDVAVDASNYNPFADKIDLAKENMKAIELKRTGEGRAGVSEEIRVEEAPMPTVSKEETARAESSRAKEAIENTEKSRIAQVLGESALIIYDAKGKVEKAVIKIADEFIKNNREAVIVAAQPRTNIYRSKLRQAIGSGKIKVIDLASDKQTADANEVLSSNLKSFESIFKEMPAGSVLIFDALSSLIIKEGGVMTYKLISDAIQYFSAEGLCLVCLIDRSAHEERDVKSFENLFVNLVNLVGDRFELVN